MVDLVLGYIIPAAYAVLPPAMRSTQASAMLLAIGLQETRLLHREQLGGGHALSLWQYEPGDLSAFAGVFRHAATATYARSVVKRLCYSELLDVEQLRQISAHNDVLACAVARLLLWTLPADLPGPSEAERAWQQYLDAWRPGAPRPETWAGLYQEAWERVQLGSTSASLS